MLVQTVIYPIIEYGDMCYFELNADVLNKLDRLLNKCDRFIFDKHSHIFTYWTQVPWLPIRRQRRSFHALNTLYTLPNNPIAHTHLTLQFKLLRSNQDRYLRSHNSFYSGVQNTPLLSFTLLFRDQDDKNRDKFKAKVPE